VDMSDKEADKRPVGETLGFADPDERKSALLTKSHRQFLYDPTSIAESSHSTTRLRIRKRIRNGLRDFDYMSALLSNDLDTIMSNFDEGEGQEVLTTVLAFLWDLSQRDADTDFETALEDAIQRERPKGARIWATNVSVDIDVDYRKLRDPDRLKRKLRAGEDLSDSEIAFLVRNRGGDEIAELLEKLE
jgi:hypothetical protein